METTLTLKGRTFTIDSSDGKKTCIYKALATLPEGEWADSNEIAAALAEGHYSMQTIRIALCGVDVKDMVKRLAPRRAPGEKAKPLMYRLQLGALMPTEKLTGVTKKQLYERRFV